MLDSKGINFLSYMYTCCYKAPNSSSMIPLQIQKKSLCRDLSSLYCWKNINSMSLS